MVRHGTVHYVNIVRYVQYVQYVSYSMTSMYSIYRSHGMYSTYSIYSVCVCTYVRTDYQYIVNILKHVAKFLAKTITFEKMHVCSAVNRVLGGTNPNKHAIK